MKHPVAAIALFVALVGGLSIPAESRSKFNLLAVSWQASFCEQRSDRPECKTQTANRYDASHFSLHGLWPGSRKSVYCNISPSLVDLDKKGRWGRLPDLNLEAQLASRLAQVMPGTRSFLQRHEWVKHGSCHENGSANGYFDDSLRLMGELNNSAVQRLFAENIGKHLDVRKIQAAFDHSFGAGAGKRIKLQCRRDGDRLLIQQMTIALYGAVDKSNSLADLMGRARGTSPGCKGGIVDAVGLQ